MRVSIISYFIAMLYFMSPNSVSAAGLTIEQLRDLDSRVAVISYRLRKANVALCRSIQSEVGVLLHAIDQYPKALQPQVQSAFRFAAPVSVEFVVPDSAADHGGLRADDGVLAINNRTVGPRSIVPVPPPTTDTRDRAIELLNTAAPTSRMSLLVLRDGLRRVIHVLPHPACAAVTEVVLDRGNAVADDGTIQIGAELAVRLSDSEMVVILAHELAHVVLEHGRRLKAAAVQRGLAGEFGRSRRLVRLTEDEADRLSAYLLANAGYRLADAARFWRTRGSKLDGGVFRSRTHSGAITRARIFERISSTIAADETTPIVPDIIQSRDRPLL